MKIPLAAAADVPALEISPARLAAVKLIYAFREWALERGMREIQFSVRSGKDIARTGPGFRPKAGEA